MTDVRLTTTDNPWNPFTRFDEWYAYDTYMGYHTSAYLARVTRTSEELSITDQEQANELAVDEIVRENLLGIYRKVDRASAEEYTPSNPVQETSST